VNDTATLKLCLPNLRDLIKKTAYNEGKENKTSGFPNKINNVTDAEKSLRVLMREGTSRNNAYYNGDTSLGTLKINGERDMNFVSA
jgi:hypothetical protein